MKYKNNNANNRNNRIRRRQLSNLQSARAQQAALNADIQDAISEFSLREGQRLSAKDKKQSLKPLLKLLIRLSAKYATLAPSQIEKLQLMPKQD